MSKIQYEDKSIEYLGGSTIVGNGAYKFYRIRESDSKHALSRAEYIVPQMLLQWITSNSRFQGICYTTSHIDFTNNNFEGNFRNYVIPSAKREKDYCSRIGQMFKMTEAVSAELISLNKNTNIIMHNSCEHRNEKAKFIEIIKGKNQIMCTLNLHC